MKICHVCKAECEENAELCPICGADLSIEIAGDEADSQNSSEIIIKNPVLVASVEDVVSAQIFKDILTENQIPFTGGDASENGSMRVVFGGGFISEDIYVDSDDFERAESLYLEFLESEAEFDGEFYIEDEESSFDEEI